SKVTDYTGKPGQWDIGFGGPGAYKNETWDPDMPEPLTLISSATASAWNINWDDSQTIFKLYVQIYQLLGSVESAQFSVLNRLAQGHNFLEKSYWLNTGGPDALAESAELGQSFGFYADQFPSDVKFQCVQKVHFCGNKLVGQL